MLTGTAAFYDITITEKVDYQAYIVHKSGKHESTVISSVVYHQGRFPHCYWYVKGTPWKDYLDSQIEVDHIMVILGLSCYKLVSHEKNIHGILEYIGEEPYG